MVAHGFAKIKMRGISQHLYLFNTVQKELPENKSEVIGPVNANTGYTYRCEKNNEIVIYRQEEWFKVLMHETMHTFGNDFETEDYSGGGDNKGDAAIIKTVFASRRSQHSNVGNVFGNMGSNHECSISNIF